MAETERYSPRFIDEIDQIRANCGLQDETIIIRITDSPNGYGRAMLAEIALVSKAPGRLTVKKVKALGTLPFDGRLLNPSLMQQ